MSPFTALFGRAPLALPAVENPELLPEGVPGSEFLEQLVGDLSPLHSYVAAGGDAAWSGGGVASGGPDVRLGGREVCCGLALGVVLWKTSFARLRSAAGVWAPDGRSTLARPPLVQCQTSVWC